MADEASGPIVRDSETGRLLPGVVLNPTGQRGPTQHAEFRQLCREFTISCWKDIKARVKSELSDPESNCAMTKIVIEHGFGKPRQQVDVSLATENKTIVMESASPETLDAMETRLREAMDRQAARAEAKRLLLPAAPQAPAAEPESAASVEDPPAR